MLTTEKLNTYLNCKVGVELNSGKYVYGVLTELDELSIKVEFVNKEKVMLIPIHSIISLRLI